MSKIYFCAQLFKLVRVNQDKKHTERQQKRKEEGKVRHILILNGCPSERKRVQTGCIQSEEPPKSPAFVAGCAMAL